MPQPRGMTAPRPGDGVIITAGVFAGEPARAEPGSGMFPFTPFAVPYEYGKSAAVLAALRLRVTAIRNRV